ncbi:hypothetical protein BGZ63DRAFT_394766 [Mariannaea sp. PMI_226]|nr:hypothetical protein BGZ63DRAFT_394766 [Mariannaea sp. PMI_226]
MVIQEAAKVGSPPTTLLYLLLSPRLALLQTPVGDQSTFLLYQSFPELEPGKGPTKAQKNTNVRDQRKHCMY